MKNDYNKIVKKGLAFNEKQGYISVKILRQNGDFYYYEDYESENPDLNEE